MPLRNGACGPKTAGHAHIWPTNIVLLCVFGPGRAVTLRRSSAKSSELVRALSAGGLRDSLVAAPFPAANWRGRRANSASVALSSGRNTGPELSSRLDTRPISFGSWRLLMRGAENGKGESERARGWLDSVGRQFGRAQVPRDSARLTRDEAPPRPFGGASQRRNCSFWWREQLTSGRNERARELIARKLRVA